MSTSPRGYHHGDLRAALTDAATTLVAQADELSLREVARQVGVSATAVYRHFPDKAALLSAVAAAGLARLGEAQRAAFAAADGGPAGFDATGVAYVRFALDHPRLFRLIFARPMGGAGAKATDATDDAMTFLLANAAAFAPAGTDAGVFALRAWSLAHGLALLMLDGLVPAEIATAQRVIDVRAIGGG